MKFMFMCAELHKHVKHIYLATITQVHHKAWSHAASQIVFDCHGCSCEGCLHLHHQMACSQPFVIFRVLQKNVLFAPWVIYVFISEFCKCSLKGRKWVTTWKEKYGVTDTNEKAMCIPQFSSVITWAEKTNLSTNSLIKFVESSSNIYLQVSRSIKVLLTMEKHYVKQEWGPNFLKTSNMRISEGRG
jgi:hypothetical protein